MTKIVDVLSEWGDVHVTKPPTQEDLLNDHDVLVVHCQPGLFPAFGSHLVDKTMSVYVNKNFREIFQYLKLQSGWEAPASGEVKRSRSAQVSGPQGSGQKMLNI